MNKKVETILENFDFERVHKVMVFLNWTWITSKTEKGVPSIYELIREAEYLLKESYKSSMEKQEDSGRATGGFKALSFWEEEKGEVDLSLSFEVDSWDTFND